MRLRMVKIALYAGMTLSACLIALFIFQAAFLDRFLQRRITTAFADAYPAYSIQMAGLHYSVTDNRLECDSIALMKLDSTFSCSVAGISVSGIGRIQLLWGGGVAPDNLVSSEMNANNVLLNFHELGYELHCGRLHVSGPDSVIVADGIELHPQVNDEEFFAGSKFRKTRYRLVLPHLRVAGSACLGLLEGHVSCARTAQLDSADLDILINKEKPYFIDSLQPPMPNDLLASIIQIVQLDELEFTDGRLNYCERFAVAGKPARLTFDNIQILAEASSNRMEHQDTVVIRAEGTFMNAGMVKTVMMIPFPSAAFTLGYSGSLSGMGLPALNPFLEIAEQQRFKSGVLESLAFDVRVTAGDAKGTVTALYKDLEIAAINGRTGSESGVVNSIVSFISNNFSLHTNNLRNNPGSMKIGEVKYPRKRGEEFFEFAWFALRSGIGDVVGF